MVMRRCEDHLFVFAWEMPRVTKGVDYRSLAPKTPKIVPMSLVDLLNDAASVLRVLFQGATSHYGDALVKGVSTSVSCSWLGERNWQIEISATNAHGGMIESPDHFLRAVRQANGFLDANDPKDPGEGPWSLMRVLEEDFDPTFTWATKPGASGPDGTPRGVTLTLNCATKQEVSLEYGVPYWEKLEG